MKLPFANDEWQSNDAVPAYKGEADVRSTVQLKQKSPIAQVLSGAIARAGDNPVFELVDQSALVAAIG
jgi:hypothetical protein